MENALIIVQARLGDATLDGKVDAFDLNKLAANWQQAGKLWNSGDFTSDGKVDAFDLNALAANWQAGAGGTFEAALVGFPMSDRPSVPEPGSLAVLTLGTSALLAGRRRRPSRR